MSETYRCPHCGAAIDLADTNVATDIALCRACGKTAPFSSIVAQPELAAVDFAAPPKGVRIEKSLIDGIEITYRKLSPVLLFLIPFVVLWSGGSMFGIYGQQIVRGKFDLQMSLFGLPFLLGTVVLLSIIAFLIFGHRRISLGRGECEVFMGVGPLGWRRTIPLTTESVVRLEISSVRVNHVQQRDVVVTTGDRKIKFGATVPEDVRVFIAAVLQKAVPSG